MAARGIGRASAWHRLVSWVAVYALVLQSIIVGMGPVLAAAAPYSLTGFEICQHAPANTDSDTGIPAQHPQDHCKFCLSIAHAVTPVPRPMPHVIHDVVIAVAQPAPNRDIPAPPALFYEPPRGPPAAA